VVIYLGVGFWLFYLLISIDFCCLANFDRSKVELIGVKQSKQSSMPLGGCLPLWLSVAIGFGYLANFDRSAAEFSGEQRVIAPIPLGWLYWRRFGKADTSRSFSASRYANG
jgi:hypothetical protein